mgnify:CR=1 FL=1
MIKRVHGGVLAVVGVAVIAVFSSAVAGAAVAPSPSSSVVVADISPELGQVVGTAQPVTVRFSAAVTVLPSYSVG